MGSSHWRKENFIWIWQGSKTCNKTVTSLRPQGQRIPGKLTRRGHWKLLNPHRASGQFSRSVLSNSLQPHGLQHPRLPCPSPTPRVYSNSCPSSQWCHPTISSSVIHFSSCPQSFPAAGSFQMSQLRWLNYWSFSFKSILLMSIQDWFPKMEFRSR